MQDNDIESCSTHNNEKSITAEGFIRKIYLKKKQIYDFNTKEMCLLLN